FGLTIFPQPDNHLEFRTLAERIAVEDTVNWSNRFQSLERESYIYGNYGQKNFFRYTYNDKEQDHHDGSFTIQNVNLEPSKNVIQSKIYAPEKFPTWQLPSITNVYKLWESEVKEV